MKGLNILGVSVVFLAMLPASALAQSSTATLRVRVTDPSSAVVPGATMTLVDVAKGIRHEAVTDTNGQYTFTFLNPGAYDLEVQASGFTTFSEKGIRLEVGQAGAIDVQLAIGASQQLVEVTAAGPLLDTASASLGQMVDRHTMDALPLNGRNPIQLAQLDSAVATSTGSRSSNPNNAAVVAVSVNGGRALTNELLLDGATLGGKADNWPLTIPSQDAVQEFRVLTNSYSAEYGRTGGGTLTFTTRSGSNQFHGTVWEFFRNDALDANTFFSNKQGVDKGKLRYNQFGGNFGGPILRNKLFFFVNFEELKTSTGGLVQSTVPTAKMKKGDFSELKAPIYMPGPSGQRVQFKDNMIPLSMQDPVAQKILSYYPDPNRPGFLNNYVAADPATGRDPQLIGRFDYHMTDTQQLFFRFTRDWILNSDAGNFPGSVATRTNTANQTSDPQSAAIDYVNTLSPHLVLHVNGSASRNTTVWVQPSSGFDLTTLGFPAYMNTAAGDVTLFPLISPTGYSGLGPLAASANRNTYQNTYTLASDLTMIQGRHNLKVGADFRIYQVNNYRSNNPSGSFSFTRSFTARTPTDTASGDPIASLLLGIPSAGTLGIVPRLAAQNKYFAVFVQDNWTLTNKLTVNLGLRYESDLPTTERYDRMTNLALKGEFPVTPTFIFPANLNLPPRTGPLTGTVTFIGSPGDRGLSSRDLNNFGPRVGVAYKLTDRIVIRSGAGIFYSPIAGGAIAPNLLAMLTSQINTTYVATLDNGVTPTPGQFLRDPFPNGVLQVPGRSQGALTGYGLQPLQGRLEARSILTSPSGTLVFRASYRATWSEKRPTQEAPA